MLRILTMVLVVLFCLFFLLKKNEYPTVSQPEIFNEINSYLNKVANTISFSFCKKLFNFPSKDDFKKKGTSKLYNTEHWFYTINASKNFTYNLYFSERNGKILSCGYRKRITPSNTSFEIFKMITSHYMKEFTKFKLLASFSCNKGNISLFLFKLPDDVLLIYGYYYQLPEEKVPGGFTVKEWFRTEKPHEGIFMRKFLTSLDPYAYFNLTIMPFRDHYCNPDIPIMYRIEGSRG